jgi:hypothetical protein
MIYSGCLKKDLVTIIYVLMSFINMPKESCSLTANFLIDAIKIMGNIGKITGIAFCEISIKVE